MFPTYDAGFWKEMHARFMALVAEEDSSMCHEASACLRAIGKYRENLLTEWKIFGGASEDFQARFELCAARCGVRLRTIVEARLVFFNPGEPFQPIEFWLRNLFFTHSQHYTSEYIYNETGGGAIYRVCEASARYCAHLQMEAIESGPRLGMPTSYLQKAKKAVEPIETVSGRSSSTPITDPQSPIVVADLPGKFHPDVRTKRGTKMRARPSFPQRAAWLDDRLAERAWNRNDPLRHGGPDPKTIDRLLLGKWVREDVLEKLVKALSQKKGSVDLLDIPRS